MVLHSRRSLLQRMTLLPSSPELPFGLELMILSASLRLNFALLLKEMQQQICKGKPFFSMHFVLSSVPQNWEQAHATPSHLRTSQLLVVSLVAVAA